MTTFDEIIVYGIVLMIWAIFFGGIAYLIWWAIKNKNKPIGIPVRIVK